MLRRAILIAFATAVITLLTSVTVRTATDPSWSGDGASDTIDSASVARAPSPSGGESEVTPYPSPTGDFNRHPLKTAEQAVSRALQLAHPSAGRADRLARLKTRRDAATWSSGRSPLWTGERLAGPAWIVAFDLTNCSDSGYPCGELSGVGVYYVIDASNAGMIETGSVTSRKWRALESMESDDIPVRFATVETLRGTPVAGNSEYDDAGAIETAEEAIRPGSR